MSLRLIPANEYRRERWRNGFGWTREIARSDVQEFESTPDVRALAEGPAYDWDWRLSIAEVDSDCPFSAFPGCDRVLLLLSGNGMELKFDDGEASTVAPPHGRVAFAGERGLQCRLLDGPTTDFNAIVRRDRCTMQVWHRPLVGSMVFFAEAGVLWAIHLIAGRATIKSAGESASLDAGDTALLETGVTDASVRSILDGGGDVVLVRIQHKA
ncbi:MAG TPA: HutD family protein [Xanthomonadaceae bacterium]|nr:HutD family protein [Xanthomonadaceae bacterium]